MIFNLLTVVQDNYKTEPIEPIFSVGNNVYPQFIIIMLLVISVIAIICAGILIYTLYKKYYNILNSDIQKQTMSCKQIGIIILIIAIALIVTIIAFGIYAITLI